MPLSEKQGRDDLGPLEEQTASYGITTNLNSSEISIDVIKALEKKSTVTT